MTLKDELDIYDVLESNYSAGDVIPLSIAGYFLRMHQITPDRYGFDKLMTMFEAMSDICILHSEEPHPGLPLVWYITLLERPEPTEELDKTLRGEESGFAKTDYSQLPENMENETVFFHYNLQNIISDNLTGLRESRATPEMVAAIRADYLKALRDKNIWYDEERDVYIFRLTQVSAQGKILIISLCRSNRSEGSPWIVKYVGPDSEGIFTSSKEMHALNSIRPGNALRNFAYLGNMTSFLRNLAEHVQEEIWNFTGQEDDYSILHQYINYTFYRLQQQDKESIGNEKICIAADGSFAVFNTGLQSRRLGEDVFAFFVPNESEKNSDWRFLCFCSVDSRDAGEQRCYKRMVSEFKEPEAATYFSKVTDLLFDPACDVRLSSDHILRDNCDRLPMAFLQRECSWSPKASAILEQLRTCTGDLSRKELFGQLGNAIVEDPDLYTSLNERIQGALSRSIRNIRRNYKLAVPCFFPTRNVMNMMIPLSFTSTGHPSVVLLCERTYSGDYLGQTILTLPMAYVNARLICPLDGGWLNTENIAAWEESFPADGE